MYEIATNRDAVKAYLKHAMELEGNIYTAQRICEQLRNRAAELAIPKTIKEVEKTSVVRTIFAGLILSVIPALISFLVVEFIFQGGGTSIALLVVVGFIMFGLLVVYFPEKKTYDAYCKEVEDERQRIKTEDVAKRVLLKEAEIIERKMQSSKKLLDSLYSMNVVHEKYRNLVAVTQLYEYFDTRRRNILEGNGGAYDLFEEELRKDMIIDRLDKIISQLDKLQRTLFLLFQELNKTNEILSSLGNDIRSANITLQGIQNMAAITAFNSTVIARETGARDYINYYGR